MINIHGHTLFLQTGKAIPLTVEFQEFQAISGSNKRYKNSKWRSKKENAEYTIVFWEIKKIRIIFSMIIIIVTVVKGCSFGILLIWFCKDYIYKLQYHLDIR